MEGANLINYLHGNVYMAIVRKSVIFTKIMKNLSLQNGLAMNPGLEADSFLLTKFREISWGKLPEIFCVNKPKWKNQTQILPDN